jgi:hypothetical protein
LHSLQNSLRISREAPADFGGNLELTELEDYQDRRAPEAHSVKEAKVQSKATPLAAKLHTLTEVLPKDRMGAFMLFQVPMINSV